MNAFFSVINILAPLFILTSLGFVAYKKNILKENHVKALSQFTNDICVPVIFVRLLSRASFPDSSTLSLIALYNLIILICFSLAFFTARHFFPQKHHATFIGFGAIFSNTFLLGVPLAITIFGEHNAIPYLVIISIDILVVFSLILILLESQSLPPLISHSKKTLLLSQKIIKNPIIIGIIFGLLLNLSSLSLPSFIDTLALNFQHMNTPLALTALGACLASLGVQSHILLAITVSLTKLILVPALTLTAIILIGNVPPLWAQSLLLMASLPVGISVFVFASRYNSAQDFAASTVLISSFLSPLSLALLLTLFDNWQPFLSLFS